MKEITDVALPKESLGKRLRDKFKKRSIFFKIIIFILLCFGTYFIGHVIGLYIKSYLTTATRPVEIICEDNSYSIPADKIEYFVLYDGCKDASNYIQLQDGTLQHFTVEKVQNTLFKITITVSEVQLRNLEEYKE